MEAGEINSWRLKNQQLTEPRFNYPGELVSWMGAMQAQDFPMVRWAIGIRLPGISESEVKEAFNRGDVVRTHLLRPTWHVVHSADLGWILRLTAPAIKRTMLSSEKTVGLSEKDFIRSNKLIEKRLQRDGPMTREELKSFFDTEGLETKMNMPAHYLMHAELAGIICSGPFREGQLTYTLIGDWIRDQRIFSREESLTELALRYFQSHGPATIRDFSWWSGLNLTDAKTAIALNEKRINRIRIGEQDFWFREGEKPTDLTMQKIWLLPAYDELVISYKDRSHILKIPASQNAISSNGVFKALILDQGMVTGTWSLKKNEHTFRLAFDYFGKSGKKPSKALNLAADDLANFLTRSRVI